MLPRPRSTDAARGIYASQTEQMRVPQSAQSRTRGRFISPNEGQCLTSVWVRTREAAVLALLYGSGLRKKAGYRRADHKDRARRTEVNAERLVKSYNSARPRASRSALLREFGG